VRVSSRQEHVGHECSGIKNEARIVLFQKCNTYVHTIHIKSYVTIVKSTSLLAYHLQPDQCSVGTKEKATRVHSQVANCMHASLSKRPLNISERPKFRKGSFSKKLVSQYGIYSTILNY
jgi:hypothetical protein